MYDMTWVVEEIKNALVDEQNGLLTEEELLSEVESLLTHYLEYKDV